MLNVIWRAAFPLQLLTLLTLLIVGDLFATSAAAQESSTSTSTSTSASTDSLGGTVSEQGEEMGGHSHHMVMSAALGAYPMTREASGTAWQPDSSVHAGVHLAAGEWMVMTHALLDAVYDHQDGPRGGSKTFAAGMLMSAATRVLPTQDVVRLRAMLSPDPLMGAAGYPLLLATGETANGRDPLIDRQHPHNLVMELSGSVSHPLGRDDSVYLYTGLPGEPAFGPPPFMHRLSILDSPEAPVTHHWLDSTHITNGVVTVGLVHDVFKLEASRFRGREPDQHRYDIEPGNLDSTAVRFSWNPAATLALQMSWARQISPEQLAPREDDTRAALSAIYTVPLEGDGYWSTTAAYGYRRSTGGPGLRAYLLESAVKPAELWTLFGRLEHESNNELTGSDGLRSPVYAVGKFSMGAIRDVALATHIKAGLGAVYAFNFLPAALTSLYGHEPAGMMLFVRLKIE
ncbi:MAG: hypothetical protein JOZ93_18460 [Sinobacteraceae bacterium]|nr:hypothetical protein [Nevskiaceae bacterium]